jgi:DNA-binding LacI/PurR family transcriptional regulator
VAKPPSRIPRQRPALRQDEVVDALQRRITGGALEPGDAVPTRAALMAEFGVSSITLQRAFDRLAALGLVVARGPQGTFVAERPPHLHRFALVFHSAPAADGTWSRFYRALDAQAHRLRQDGIDLRCWYGAADDEAAPALAELEGLAARGALAGIVFAYRPPHVHGPGSPLMAGAVPRAAITSQPLAGVAAIRLDRESFIDHLVARLRAAGKRRIAVIATATYLEAHGAHLGERLRTAGFDLRPQWLLGADMAYPHTATALVRLLFAPWAMERPDALFIADDNLEEAAVGGLLAEGVRVGRDLAVFAHGNFPLGAASQLPITRIGYHAAAVLGAALGALRDQRGRPVADVAVAASVEGEE